jgi:uncharacterized membrane protein YqjE
VDAVTKPDGSSPDVSDHSVGELFGRVTSDLSTLLRQEVELAKAELREEAVKAGKAGAMFGGAGVLGHLTLAFLALAMVYGLGNVMDLGWAALITAVVLGAGTAILALLGRNRARQINPVPERTVQTVKEDVQWARTRSS